MRGASSAGQQDAVFAPRSRTLSECEIQLLHGVIEEHRAVLQLANHIHWDTQARMHT